MSPNRRGPPVLRPLSDAGTRRLPVWVLIVGLSLLIAGSVVLANQLRRGYEHSAQAGAEVTARSVTALSVQRNVGRRDIRLGLTGTEVANMQADVSLLLDEGLLEGLEIWRPDGSLLFADAAHPVAEQRLPSDELARLSDDGEFLKPGDPNERGHDTWEMFLTYDLDADGETDAIIEVILPDSHRQELSTAVRRLYAGVAVLALFVSTVLISLFRRLRQRQHEALHDPLTGLANRRALSVAGDDMRRRRGGEQAALVLLDLDRFKAVNDTMGHAAGDALLQQVGQALTASVRSSDLVIRLGGDEFAVLLRNIDGRAAAMSVATDVLAELGQRRFLVQGVSLEVEASAGVALLPDDAPDVEGLLQRSDVAMYEAKRRRVGACPYDSSLDGNDLATLRLLAGLRQAIEDGQLVLHYQPKARLPCGTVLGVEALVRWQHPDLGLLPPADFLVAAEQTGLIHPLTDWVLRQACQQAAEWSRRGQPLSVAVNISPRSLLGAHLPERIRRVLHETGLPATSLEVEITETAITGDPAAAQAVLQRLRAMGVTVSLDDFGTGYTSMTSLRTLPVQILKIDRSFVTEMLDGDRDAAITESLITLAHRLGMGVVAEGVETAAVWERLAAMGCDWVQGYVLARPMPAPDVLPWLSASGRAEKHRPDADRPLVSSPVGS